MGRDNQAGHTRLRGHSNEEQIEDDELCFFCKGKKGQPACYARRVDGAPATSRYYPACESCARRPYPQPKQFQHQEVTS